MHLIVVGINHRTAGVDIRGKFYFSEDMIRDALPTLKAYDSIIGTVILSTCNRTEIYASANSIEHGLKDLTAFLCTNKGVSTHEITPYIYTLNCREAVLHLFKVASGIDSMVLGEYQIQRQLRDAYCLATAMESTDSYINKVFQYAISTGKRVRSETKIGRGSLSVANLAIELIKKVYSTQQQLSLLVVGAGKMAHLVASNLHDICLLYTSPSPRDRTRSRMPSSA